MSAPAADAQVTHMNSRTKMALFNAFTQGIQKTVAAGKTGAAKVGCLAAFHLIQSSLKIPRFIQRNRQAITDYDKVCEPLYKNHTGNGGAAVVAQYQEKIKLYGAALGFPPFGRAPTNSAGYISAFDRYKRIVEAPLIADKALAYAVEYVEKLPKLSVLLARPPRGFGATLPALLNIVTGKNMAKPLIDKKAVPGIVAEADKLVGAFRPTWHPKRITQEIAKVNNWIQLLEQAKPGHPKIASYQAHMAKMKVAAVKRWKAFVAKQRMPKDKYKGGDRARLVSIIKKSYLARYGRNEKVLRVVIEAESWGPARGTGWWKKNRWYWSVFSKLSPVVVAVEQKIKGKTKYKMFRLTMARERKGRSWTKPYISGNTDHGAPILKKNIFK